MKNKRGKKNRTMQKSCIFIAHKLSIYHARAQRLVLITIMGIKFSYLNEK